MNYRIGVVEMNSVLVVDSNRFFRKSFKDILQVYMPDLIVEEASDASDAMRRIHSRSPDIVFMDIRLEGKSALKIGKRIKEQHPETVLCIFADYDLPEYRRIASQYGVDHFLLKDSLSGAEIANLIKYAISAKASGF